ncbi:hypothetical protein DFH11DRAFT_1730525 [Phellopilus nigrolimitatus]|nr:hypothetical protein DFH11DRAFT_1730525 [Phellopilus nigrolimitatus]
MADPSFSTGLNREQSSRREEPSRPTLFRNNSLQPSTNTASAFPTFSSSPSSHFRPYTFRHAQSQTSLLSFSEPRSNAQVQTQSPSQHVPRRPVLPHMHSLHSMTATPQENRVDVNATLPRRGSLSSASAAAATQSGSYERPNAVPLRARRGTTSNVPTNPPASMKGTPVFVPPSSLGLGKPHAGGLWENQDSD